MCTRLVSRIKLLVRSPVCVARPRQSYRYIVCVCGWLFTSAALRPAFRRRHCCCCCVALASCWHKNYLPFCVFFFLWFIYIITLCVTIIPNAHSSFAHSHMWHRISHRFRVYIYLDIYFTDTLAHVVVPLHGTRHSTHTHVIVYRCESGARTSSAHLFVFFRSGGVAWWSLLLLSRTPGLCAFQSLYVCIDANRQHACCV